jgi:transposase
MVAAMADPEPKPGKAQTSLQNIEVGKDYLSRARLVLRFVPALAEGKSQREAAKEAGVSQDTARRQANENGPKGRNRSPAAAKPPQPATDEPKAEAPALAERVRHPS